jgi:hypothetical protein
MSDTTRFHTAQRDVPVPATRQPLFATETLAIEAIIQADPLNTTNILIFDRLVGGVQGAELTPGDSMPVNAQWVMDLPDLSAIYIDTVTADDFVTITWRD